MFDSRGPPGFKIPLDIIYENFVAKFRNKIHERREKARLVEMIYIFCDERGGNNEHRDLNAILLRDHEGRRSPLRLAAFHMCQVPLGLYLCNANYLT